MPPPPPFLQIRVWKGARLLTLNGQGGGGAFNTPPHPVYISSFLCEKDKEPKLYDFYKYGYDT